MATHRYWMLSNFGEAHEPRTEGYRCLLERIGVDPPHCIPFDQAIALWEGRSIPDWDASLVVRCEEPGPLEDFPWCNEHIASDRLRLLLERLAPGCAQFLAITLLQHDGTPSPQPYWIVNWLHTVDFYDREFTDMARSPEHTSFFEVVVDASRIPPDKPICRMHECQTYVAIRDDIKSAIERAGMTGCQFYTATMLDDVLRKRRGKRKQE